jgi:hypothetical protein
MQQVDSLMVINLVIDCHQGMNLLHLTMFNYIVYDLWNIGKFLPDYMEHHPEDKSSSLLDIVSTVVFLWLYNSKGVEHFFLCC